MSFASLSARTARLTGRLFGPTAAGKATLCWLPATAEAQPTTLAGYTLAAGPATPGPVRHRSGDPFANVDAPDATLSLHLDGTKVPYDPTLSQTTLLLGPTPATAVRYIILSSRRVGGLLELDVKKTAPLST